MLSEQDIELLEMHLDGELDSPANETLRGRLEREPELAAELQRLRRARELRASAWRGLESPELNAEAMLAKVRPVKPDRWKLIYWIHDQRERIAAIAACVAVFVIGWQWGRTAPYRLIRGGPSSTPVILQSQMNGQQVYEVRVRDTATGEVLRQERFGSMADAERFISEQSKQMQEREQTK